MSLQTKTFIFASFVFLITPSVSYSDQFFKGGKTFEELIPPKNTHQISLSPIKLDLADKTEESLVQTVKGYLKNYPELMSNIGLDQLKLLKVYEIPETRLSNGEIKPAMSFIHFIQEIPDPSGELENLPVEGSFLRITVKYLDQPTIVDAQSQLYEIPMTFQNGLQKEQMLDRIRPNLKLPADLKPFGEKIVIRYIDGTWRRIYEFRYDDSGERVLVDTQTGEFWTTSDIVYAQYENNSSRIKSQAAMNTGVKIDPKYIQTPTLTLPDNLRNGPLILDPDNSISGYVYGAGVLFDPVATGHNLDLLRLSDLEVYRSPKCTNLDYTHTNTNGYFFLLSEEIPNDEIYARLKGKWADVNDASGPNLEMSYPFLPGIRHDLVFNDEDWDSFSTTTAQVNGYYHTTFIHNWMKERLPNLTSLDITIPVTVNEKPPKDSGPCNAGYDNDDTSIHFGPEPDDLEECGNWALDTVIYHEYGHFVDYMAGGKTNSALSEGWGDILSAYPTSQPLNGEGLKGQEYIRTADNNYQYDSDDEEHTQGQAWAGFAWELRKIFIQEYGEQAGVELAEYLVITTFLANSESIPDAVFDVFLIDDNDDYITNGTPHDCEIFEAARRHNIPINDAVGANNSKDCYDRDSTTPPR